MGLRYVSLRELEIIKQFIQDHTKDDARLNVMSLLKPHFSALLERLEAVCEEGHVPLTQRQVAAKITSLKRSESNAQAKKARTRRFAYDASKNLTDLETLSNNEEAAIRTDYSSQTVSKAITNPSRTISTHSAVVESCYSQHRNILESYGIDAQEPWQDGLYSSWQSYLRRRGHALSVSIEPLDYERVEKDTGKILTLVQLACAALLRTLPHCYMLNVAPDLVDGFMNIVTGKSGQPAINDLKIHILQSCHASLPEIDLCCALVGAAIYKWVFQESITPTCIVDTSNHVTQLMLRFLEEDCPKIWKEYQYLHRQNQLLNETSHYTNQLSTQLANQLYNLFQASHRSTVLQNGNTLTREQQVLSSEDSKAKEINYHEFLNNMTQAMTTALNVRRDLEKCTDVKYSFQFPRIKELFDPAKMRTRDDDSMQKDKDRSILVALFPSIWSAIEGADDSMRILSKAVVIL